MVKSISDVDDGICFLMDGIVSVSWTAVDFVALESGILNNSTDGLESKKGLEVEVEVAEGEPNKVRYLSNSSASSDCW